MKRPCLGCGRLIGRGSYCSRCRKARQVARRGSSGRQADFRQKVLAATGGRCAICGSSEGVQAHHLRPLGEGGDPKGPGLPLCAEHHRLAHRFV